VRSVIPCLCSLPTEPSPESHHLGDYVCAGGTDILKFDKNSMIYSVSYSNFRGLVAFFRGLSPPKPSWRREWLPTDVYFKNCVTKPCQLGLRRFGCSAVITTSHFRRFCDEQLYSVQPLPSCTTISINALFNKSVNHNHIQRYRLPLR